MQVNEEIIFFVHMPKCGGKSFRKGLEAAYGDSMRVFNLNPISHKPWSRLRYQGLRLRSKALLNSIPNDVKLIYGHFCFDDVPIGATKTVRRGAFFRDPIEWVGSYFFYLRDKRGTRIPKHPLELARQFNLAQGFKKFLGAIEVESLDFVGLAESYEKSLELFSSLYSVSIPSVRVNVTRNAPGPEGENGKYRQYFRREGFLDELEGLMKNNIAIYHAAKRRHSILVKQQGLESG